MQYTQNFNLSKPEASDIIKAEDLSTNIDTLDSALAPSADPAQIPVSNVPGKLSQWVSWLTNRIKAVTGKANWYDAPDVTLTGAKAHIDAPAPHSGHVLSSDVVVTAAPNKILKLNASGKLPASITGGAKELVWSYLGDGCTIADNSSGALPGGSMEAEYPWSPTYPILVGYNGTNTYGVRVDSARSADSLTGDGVSAMTGTVELLIYGSLLN